MARRSTTNGSDVRRARLEEVVAFFVAERDVFVVPPEVWLDWMRTLSPCPSTCCDPEECEPSE